LLYFYKAPSTRFYHHFICLLLSSAGRQHTGKQNNNNTFNDMYRKLKLKVKMKIKNEQIVKYYPAAVPIGI